MPKKIHKLNEHESYDFGLIGIASPENDYRISWIFNNALDFSLVREEDLEIIHKLLDEPQLFHQFRYFDEESLLLYRLITNKCENGYLLEELAKVDFILQISGEMDTGHIDMIINKLNTLEGVTLAFPLDPSVLKSRKKLLD